MIHFKNTISLRGLMGVLAVYLVLVLPNCGPKRNTSDSNVIPRAVTGYVFVNEISGKLGSAVLSRPACMSLDPSGNLIVVDAGNHRLVKVSQSGEFMGEVGGFGFSREQFNSPASLATSDRMNLYLLDASNSRIVRLDYDLNWLSEFNLDEIQTDFRVGRGAGLAVNSFGDIYISDPENSRVLRLDRDYRLLAELNELGGFLEPGPIAVDADDNIYVVNLENSEVVSFDTYDNYSGKVVSDNAKNLTGLWISRDGLLYMADSGTNSLSIFTLDGTPVYSFGSIGVGEYQFRKLHSVCANDAGMLFISDQEGHKISVFRPSGP